MKLQKNVSRRTAKKEYAKWSITIPEEFIKELNWRQGLEIEAAVRNQSLVLFSAGPSERIKTTGRKALSYYERFMRVYSNLPLEERKLPVIIIDGESFNWARSNTEIKNKTKLGKKIGEKLLKLEII